jgi:hypothetical protein
MIPVETSRTDRIKMKLEKVGYIEQPRKDGRFFVFKKADVPVNYFVSCRGHIRTGQDIKTSRLFTSDEVSKFIETGYF